MTFDVSQYELQDTQVFTVKNARGDDDLIGADGKPVCEQLDAANGLEPIVPFPDAYDPLPEHEL